MKLTNFRFETDSDGIALCDPSLLFYYQNRLAAHGVAWSPTTASRERAAVWSTA
jgi:hypothetical protein